MIGTHKLRVLTLSGAECQFGDGPQVHQIAEPQQEIRGNENPSFA